MTKREYLNLKAAKPDIGAWSYAECIAADKLIQRTTIRNLRDYLRTQKVNKVLTNFILTMTGWKFGCADIDDFLMQIKAYPNWM